MRIKINICVILLFVFCNNINTQDLLSSQYFNKSTQINPSLTGFDTGGDITFSYMKRWLGLASGYNSYGVSYSNFSDIIKGGYSIGVLHDEEADGILKTTQINAIYSYPVKLYEKGVWSFGVQASARQKQFSVSSLVLPGMIDEVTGEVSTASSLSNTTSVIPDFGVGTMLKLNNFYIGFSSYHLAEPVDMFKNKSYRSYNAQIFYNIFFNTYYSNNNYVTPIAYYTVQGDFALANVGCYLNYERFISALWYKTSADISKKSGNFGNKTLSLLLGFKFNAITIKYNYDYSLLKYSSLALSTHEFSVSYSFNKRKRKNQRDVKDFLKSLKCPSF